MMRIPIIVLVAICLVTTCRVSVSVVSARKTEMVRTPRLLARRCPQAVTAGAP